MLPKPGELRFKFHAVRGGFGGVFYAFSDEIRGHDGAFVDIFAVQISAGEGGCENIARTMALTGNRRSLVGKRTFFFVCSLQAMLIMAAIATARYVSMRFIYVLFVIL